MPWRWTNCKRRNAGAVKSIDELRYQLSAVTESLMNSTASQDLYRRAHAMDQRLARLRDQAVAERGALHAR